MTRYLVQKYSLHHWIGIDAEITNFDAAYALMDAAAQANPGVAHRIRSHGKTVGLPLMFTEQDLSKVVVYEPNRERI